MAKILQIGVIPHNMTLFKFICVQYQFHRQTLPIIKIDRGQIQFREYVSTGTEPNVYDVESPTVDSTSSSIRLTHLCAVTYITELPLHVTLSN